MPQGIIWSSAILSRAAQYGALRAVPRGVERLPEIVIPAGSPQFPDYFIRCFCKPLSSALADSAITSPKPATPRLIPLIIFSLPSDRIMDPP